MRLAGSLRTAVACAAAGGLLCLSACGHTLISGGPHTMPGSGPAGKPMTTVTDQAVGMPPSIGRAGAGAATTASSQARHA